MKNLCVLSFFVLFLSTAHAQVNNGGYTGNLVEEYVWSKTQNEYKLLESIPMLTEIVFSIDSIYFQKGANAKWLANKWVFDQTIVYDNKSEYDRYYDERNQMILIDYVSSEILYYYNWDIHTNTYSNIAIDKNLVEWINY